MILESKTSGVQQDVSVLMLVDLSFSDGQASNRVYFLYQIWHNQLMETTKEKEIKITLTLDMRHLKELMNALHYHNSKETRKLHEQIKLEVNGEQKFLL